MVSDSRLTTSEKFASLFQPDTVMPDQYRETFRRLTHLEPEKRLMLAVLEDGVACFQKYATARKGKGKRIFLETEEWILQEPNEGLFSFASVCETLGLNADYLRQGLIRWKASHLENYAKARVYQLVPLAQEKNEQAAEVALLCPPLRNVAGR